jgi:hypothetical protein
VPSASDPMGCVVKNTLASGAASPSREALCLDIVAAVRPDEEGDASIRELQRSHGRVRRLWSLTTLHVLPCCFRAPRTSIPGVAG